LGGERREEEIVQTQDEYIRSKRIPRKKQVNYYALVRGNEKNHEQRKQTLTNRFAFLFILQILPVKSFVFRYFQSNF